jgi:hypothetical protein
MSAQPIEACSLLSECRGASSFWKENDQKKLRALASPVHIPHLHGIELSRLGSLHNTKYIFIIKNKEIERGNCNSFPAYHDSCTPRNETKTLH